MKKNAIKFYKEDFLKSTYFKEKKDLINTLLEDNTMYTKSDVENIIKNFLKEVI